MNKNTWVKKIELGSAQFGMDYGINNGKKIDISQAISIYDVLYESGLEMIDTAPVYGEAEDIISKIINKNTKVITKIIPIDFFNVNEVISQIKLSISIFSDNLYGIMMHNSDDVYSKDYNEVIEYLNELKKLGIKVGVSLYDPNKIIELYNLFQFDMIQIPFSVLDQRANNSELIKFIKNKNIEIHVRSIFLQGLLLMGEDVPGSLSGVKYYTALLKEVEEITSLTIYELCIYYVFKQQWVDRVVIGLDNDTQAKKLIDTVKKLSYLDIDFDFSNLSCSDNNIINPSKWNYDN
jgi:aryl-alcohol dehydrogenase-like predicted oxidoreductase